uniref:Uncharacterized protein n=1 Tax=Avena sativa TaxID=4498 RepID=A0ACD5YAJ1_AVESA
MTGSSGSSSPSTFSSRILSSPYLIFCTVTATTPGSSCSRPSPGCRISELGGNSEWIDRFLARFSAFFYYFIAVGMYMLSPRMAYHFSECVERHAYSTYDKFLKLNGEELIKLPAPEAAIDYYMNEDLYLFDEFQTSRAPSSRRPKVDNLYDVFVNIRDDEAEHCKTMTACQRPGSIRSPHSMSSSIQADTEDREDSVSV